MITHGSLFAGIDSFAYGFSKAGIKTVWRVEIDKTCQRVLRRHYPDDLLRSDVRKCGAHNLPAVDIISFGSPCQGLSQAGQGKGLEDGRSRLFFEGIRILAELRPAFGMWENVPRALTIHRGRDFATILRAFRECGARDVAWRTLDARYCGVAQRRQRVFLVADFRGERAAEVLFESSRSAWHPAASPKERARVAATVTNSASRSRGAGTADGMPLVCAPLRGNHYGDHVATESHLVCHDASEDGTGRGVPLVFDSTQITSPGNYSHPRPGDPCHPISATAQAPCIAFDWQAGGIANDRQYIVRKGEYTGAIQHSKQDAVLFKSVIRHLTPTEIARLFAFPDDYAAFDATGKPISDNAQYRMYGNSIVATIPEWIGRRIVRLCNSRKGARYGMD